jgi:drug/metabolite transporter (DMT)-like permease
MHTELIGIYSALLSSASWALGSILFGKISEKVSPFGMTLAKGIIGVILLGAVYYIDGISALPFNVLAMLFLSGVVGIAIGDTLFFASLHNLGPKTQVIFFMTGQIITTLFGVYYFNEYPNPIQLIGIFVTLLGVVAVLWNKILMSSSTSSSIKGVIYGLLSMILFSASLILVKDVLDDVSTIGATFYRILSGTFGIMIFGLIGNNVKDWVMPFKGDYKIISLFVLSAAIVTFGGFWLSLVAIKYVNIGVASALNATEPLFVLPLAYILMKEKIKKIEIIGAICTIIGVVLLTIGSI